VELSEGRCHFRIAGDAGAPTALLLHGATVPGWEFDRLLPYLHDAGYRTLSPDFFGHGYSDRPDASHSQDLLVRQAAEFLDAVGETSPVAIVGHSLGAAVGARLAAAAPSRVRSIVLIAPLLDFASGQPGMRLLVAPGIGKLLMATCIVPMLKRRRARRYRDIDGGRFVGMFNDQFRIRGFGAALLSLIRSGALGDQSDSYRALYESGHPTLILRGMEDRVFSAIQLETMQTLLPLATVRACPGVGHPLMLTHPEIVAPLITGFLDQARVK